MSNLFVCSLVISQEKSLDIPPQTFLKLKVLVEQPLISTSGKPSLITYIVEASKSRLISWEFHSGTESRMTQNMQTYASIFLSGRRSNMTGCTFVSLLKFSKSACMVYIRAHFEHPVVCTLFLLILHLSSSNTTVSSCTHVSYHPGHPYESHSRRIRQSYHPFISYFWLLWL